MLSIAAFPCHLNLYVIRYTSSSTAKEYDVLISLSYDSERSLVQYFADFGILDVSSF